MTLSPPLSSFIGRRAELERVSALFAEGARLVTVFGAGGIGKTRLALRYADFEGTGDVVFCDLTPASDLREVCTLVARSLSLDLPPEIDAGALVARLEQAIAARGPALFVLDNCESATEAVARALEAWVPGTTSRFLLTSRELLRAAGEVAFELGPLDLPAGPDLLASEAVRLFVDRVRIVRSDYRPTDSEAASIAAIVRRLDGIPLAIELAAARGDVLSTADILARLDRALEILSSATRSGPDRQRTMNATIDWSWRTLADEEAQALAQLSVFRGGFSLEACEAVLFGGRRSPLDLLRSLRAKSLLRTFAVGSPSRMRFALYETVRQFAAATVTAEDTERLRDRHLAYCRELASVVVGCRRSEGPPRPQLEVEVENLRAALDHALERTPRHAEAALVIAMALEMPLRRRGEVSTLVRVLGSTLDASKGASVDPRLRAHALVSRARAARALGRWEQRREDLQAAVDAADEADDDHARGRALVERALGDALEGRVTAAIAGLDEALALYRRAASVPAEAEAETLVSLAYVEMTNKVRDARAHLELSLERARSSGDSALEALATNYLAYWFFGRGDLEAALRYLDRAKLLADEASDGMRRAGRDLCAARVLQELGRWDEAEAAYDGAIAFCRQCVIVGMLAETLAYSGTLLHERGDSSGALARYEEAIMLFEQAAQRRSGLLFRGFAAAVQASTGNASDAARVLAKIEPSSTEKGLSAVLALLRGHVDLAEARAAAAARDRAAATDHIARARARLETHVAGVSEPDEDARLARRLLERALTETTSRARTVARRRQSGKALVIGPEGAWFRVGAMPAVDLRRRRQLQRILLALARARAAGAEDPVSLETLFCAAWPEERALEAAAANRVRVAITTLRNLGLREQLITEDGGYTLSAATQVVFASDE